MTARADPRLRRNRSHVLKASGGVGPEDVPGTYEMQTFNGSSLPYLLYGIGSGLFNPSPSPYSHLEHATIILNPDMTCSRNNSGTSYHPNTGLHPWMDTCACTYVFDDGAITLTFPDHDNYTGSISGSQLTLEHARTGNAWVYRKCAAPIVRR